MTSFYLQYMYTLLVTAKQLRVVLPRCLCTGFAGLRGLKKDSVFSWYLVWDYLARESVVLVDVMWLWVTETSRTGYPATGVPLQREQSAVFSVQVLEVPQLPVWPELTKALTEVPCFFPPGSRVMNLEAYAVGKYELNCPIFFWLSVENHTTRIVRATSLAFFFSNCIWVRITYSRHYGKQGFF